jgi:hypothetical protein
MHIFLFIQVWLNLLFPHPLHLSITNIVYDKPSETLSFYIKVFRDDFQADAGTKKGIMFDDKNLLKETKTISNYFAACFALEYNRKTLPFLSFHLDEAKATDDSYLFTFSCKSVKPGGSLTLKNKILFQLYPDMKNMLIFKSGTDEKGCIFELNGDICEFKL